MGKISRLYRPARVYIFLSSWADYTLDFLTGARFFDWCGIAITRLNCILLSYATLVTMKNKFACLLACFALLGLSACTENIYEVPEVSPWNEDGSSNEEWGNKLIVTPYTDEQIQSKNTYNTFADLENLNRMLADTDPTNDSLALAIKNKGGTEAFSDFINEGDLSSVSQYLSYYGIHISNKIKITSSSMNQLFVSSFGCSDEFFSDPNDLNTFHFFPNGMKIFIDPLGRPSFASQEFKSLPQVGGRDDYCTRKVGKYAYQYPIHANQTYDGGHLIGDTLGGFSSRANLVPQSTSLNRGPWRKIDEGVRRCIASKISGSPRVPFVRLNITLDYGNTTNSIPEAFHAQILGLKLNFAVTPPIMNLINERADFSNIGNGGYQGRDAQTEGKNFIGNLKRSGCTADVLKPLPI